MLNLKLVCALVVFCAALNLVSLDEDAEWAAYKAEFGKNYPNATEDAIRKEIWKEAVARVAEQNRRYNAGESTWEAAINDRSDYTVEERRGGRIQPPSRKQRKPSPPPTKPQKKTKGTKNKN